MNQISNSSLKCSHREEYDLNLKTKFNLFFQLKVVHHSMNFPI
jgi:hypothetical protein